MKCILEKATWPEDLQIPKMQFDQSRLSKETRIFPMILRWAAVLVAGLSIAYLVATFSADQRIQVVADNQIKKISLPDGSEVTLNTSSSLTYSEDFIQDERRVAIDGEVFFEVKPSDIPFIITANNQTIEVLGTSFNVRTSSTKTHVEVSSGRVKFSDGNHQIVLSRGKAAQISPDGLFFSKDSLASFEIADWKSDQWTFRNESLGDIYSFLSSTYETQIIVEDPDIKDLKIFANVSKSSLDNILNNIAELHELNVRIVENRYYIER